MPTVFDEEDPPRRRLVADVLAERGVSKRGFAWMLWEADSRQSWDSWHTSVKRYTRDRDPVTPSEETVQLMENILGLPEGTLVRPTRREQREERIRLLEEENRRLRAELEAQRRDERGSGRGSSR